MSSSFPRRAVGVVVPICPFLCAGRECAPAVRTPGGASGGRAASEWWQIGADSLPAELHISFDPAGDRFLDYTRQSWFTVPRDTGDRHITGPYVDYLCTDQYTLTFTIPAQTDRFAGVVGADVFARDVEHALLPTLRRLPGRAALINSHGRVIVSNTARQATGSMVREVNIPEWWALGAQPSDTATTTLKRCGDCPTTLLVTGRE